MIVYRHIGPMVYVQASRVTINIHNVPSIMYMLSNDFLKSINQISIESLQLFLQTDMIFFNQFNVSKVKFILENTLRSL